MFGPISFVLSQRLSIVYSRIARSVICFTEYGYFKGQVLNADDLDCLYDGLKHNELHEQFSHIITGIVKRSSTVLNITFILSRELRKLCIARILYFLSYDEHVHV